MNLTYCQCHRCRTGHWHLITGNGRTIPVPIRSRQFLKTVLTHLEENGMVISLAEGVRRQIRNQEFTLWERYHLSPRALDNLCRIGR